MYVSTMYNVDNRLILYIMANITKCPLRVCTTWNDVGDAAKKYIQHYWGLILFYVPQYKHVETFL